jgi:Ca2+-binding EF-hand superfamily protein
LNQDEFDDVFCSLLNDCQEYFKLLEDKEMKQASFLEAFVALTVFSKGEFDAKIRGLFFAFDLDNSGSIEKKELLNLLQSAIFGLCKLVGIPCPHREDIS